jgi:DNA-binding MarR family transcriptional regulator
MSPSPSPSPERAELLRALGEAVRANQRGTDVVDELVGQLLGVNRTDGRLLDILEQHGRMSAGQLAQASSLTSGAITTALDRLEHAGYAQRVADPSDRRRVLVELTQRTRDLTIELFGPMLELFQPLSDLYTDEDLRLLIDFNRNAAEIQERHAELLRQRLNQASEQVRDRAPADDGQPRT